MFNEFYGLNNSNEYDEEENFIDVALICENGHVINESMKMMPDLNSEYCIECGKGTISACPSCKKEIEGTKYLEGVTGGFKMKFPSYCKHCGQPYPWTQQKLIALEEVIELMDELNESDKKNLKESAEIISTDNPRTQVGILKIKKVLGKVTKNMGDVALNIIKEVASETALKYMKQQGMI